jgi:hypothetical protein
MMKYCITLLVALQLLAGCVGATPNIPGKVKTINDERILPKCLPAPQMSRALFAGFQEILKASAILHASKKLLVLIYASRSGSFTVTLTGEDQVSCAILWGSDYSTEKNRNSVKI